MRKLLPAAGLAGVLAISAVAWSFDREPPAVPPPSSARLSPSLASGPVDPGRVLLTVEQQRGASPAAGFPPALSSILKIRSPMQYGDFLWNDRNVPPGEVRIRVDLRTQMISVFRGGHEIGTAVVLYGADGKETPLGSFPVLWKGKDHRSSLYDAPMPYTLRLTGDGVAIHGSDVRWGAATHGCVGIPRGFAARLFEQARLGDIVTIVRTSPASS